MCSEFLQSMENYQGDLADIVRGGASVTIGSRTTTAREVAAVPPDWQFPSNPTNYSSGIEERLHDFGDPFPNMQDPLLQGIDMDMDMASPVFLTTPSDTSDINPNSTATIGGGGGSGGGSNTNMFSRMLQISPTAKLPVSPCDSPVLSVVSPRLKSPTMSSVSNGLITNTANSKGCLVENAGLQISSPRITGIKRRKSQAKKVVCIPAPAPANSRSSGEVVPSDLWAWRKYGQKPIKGSPYPRGYYRCSSSKGCSARKQVERSRTDPNMLVITYTSEHNHPWPTQRNALAGSTRAQPTKNNNNNSAPKSSSSSASQLQTHKDMATSLKEEQKESNTDNNVSYSSVVVPTNPTTDNTPVKEEMEDFQKKIEMEDVDQFGGAFSQSYKPALPDSDHSHEDFFADLGEIEVDPLNLLFTQGFSGDEGRGNKALDPFSFYDWPENYSNSNSQTKVLGEAKKGLQQNP